MQAFAVSGVPEVTPGDDIAELVVANRTLRDGDVLCVASTVVSKAEGRVATLADYSPGKRARDIADRLARLTGDTKDPRFAQVVIEESAEVITEAPFLLTATEFGHIGVNAGVDRSNVGSAELLLLPERPGESADRIRRAIEADVAVIVTDTCGRPFRHGQTGVAIGWAGLPASRDWRGERDRDGYELGVTVESVVDELAGTANLLMGEGDGGTPAVVIREFEFGGHAGSDRLFRGIETDYVRQALREWTYVGD